MNTSVGVAYAVIGIPLGGIEGIGLQDGQLQVKGHALQRFLGNADSAITLGGVGIFANDPATLTRSGQPLGVEEPKHTMQSHVMGPFYLPMHLFYGTMARFLDGRWHGQTNILEQGPHQNPPRTF